MNPDPPSLRGFDPSGRDSLQGYLDFLQQTYRDDPEMLTAVANAAVRGRLETISDRTIVEELFMNDFKKHLKMKALGTVKYPAFAELIRILRDYISVPEDQLNEFVARQLTDDIRTEIENRAVEERGFTVLPEQPQICTGCP